MNDKPISPYFDPDEIVITKSIVFDFIDGLTDYWKKHKLKNAKNITTLLIWRGSLSLMGDDSVQFIFKTFIKFANKMQEINGLMKMRNEIPNAEILTKIALEKLREGKIFDTD